MNEVNNPVSLKQRKPTNSVHHFVSRTKSLPTFPSWYLRNKKNAAVYGRQEK